MSSDPASSRGTAEIQGGLWGARAQAWAAQEEQHTPLYDEAIRKTRIGRGTRVLDLGCGSGVFCRLAVDQGARVSGLDASEVLLEIARARVPEGDFRVGDLQFLPYEAGTFDVVTGFNSFQFAADTTAALCEAGRVAKPGAPIMLSVWGRADRCNLSATFGPLTALVPLPRTNTTRPAFAEPGVLEAIAVAAGLAPQTSGDVSGTFVYPDEEAMLRSMLSSGLSVLAIRTSGEAAVRSALRDALAAFRLPTGVYRLENEWHYLIASA